MEATKEIVIYVKTSESRFYNVFIEALNSNEESSIYYQGYCLPLTLTEEAIEECVKYVQKLGKRCVLALQEYSTAAAAVINKRLGNSNYPSLPSIVYCSNKLLTRLLVNDFDFFFGFNLDTPIESVLTKASGHRCILKHTMLAGGSVAYRCDDTESLRIALETIHNDKEHCDATKEQHAGIVKFLGRENPEAAKQCTQYMIEEIVEISNTDVYQFCAEGFVTNGGDVIPYSLIEQLFFKNGMFIGDITPPVNVKGALDECEDYIIGIGKKMYQLGFKNQAFNVEFWRFPNGKFRLVEINPRTATPYYFLYEQYCGIRVFEDVANLVVHGKEPLDTPFSVLKKQWPVSRSDADAKYTLNFNLTTRATGKATDLFDYSVIEELSKKGAPLFHYKGPDSVLTDIDKIYMGTSMVQVVIQGSWNEIVTQAKDLRKRFYKDWSLCEEREEYPHYFDLV